MGAAHVVENFEIGIVSPAYKTFQITNSRISDLFMIFFVKSTIMRRALVGSSVQGASIVRRNLDKEMLDEWEFQLLDLDGQIAIAELLQKETKKIQLLKSKLSKLKEQKKGLMQQLLTGKKRLKITV